jgi:hypothetical protein
MEALPPGLLFASLANHFQIPDVHVARFVSMSAFGDLSSHGDLMVQMVVQLDGVALQAPSLSILTCNQVLVFLLRLFRQTAGRSYCLAGDLRPGFVLALGARC